MRPARLHAEVCSDIAAELGEGPRWIDASKTLLWVDVRGRTLYRSQMASGILTTPRRQRFPNEINCAIPIADHPAEALVPSGGSLMRLDSTESISTVGTIEPDDRLQLNDAACDAAGRLWVGTYAKKGEASAGALFKVDLDGTVSKQLEGVTLSNGIGWSPDNERMYYVDSMTARIDLFDYDLAVGALSARRRFVALDDGPGLPDGLTVDAGGGLWIAIWDRGAVLRYSAEGNLTHRIDLPVSRPTACCFGGDDLRTLFITSAWVELSEEQRRSEPCAGCLFACTESGFQGLPTLAYAGPISENSLRR